MLTEAELSELLDIRRKIDALQMRYNELAGRMAAPPSAAGHVAAPAAAVPVAAQPQPVQVPQPSVQQVARPVVPVMAQPVAPQPVQPVAAPVQAVRVQQPIPASQLPQDELETKRIPLAPRPTVAAAVPKDPASMTIKDHVVDVLAKAGKPLPFEEIYKRLEDGKAPMPKDKPKLVIRQILYNKALFFVTHGAFSLVSGSSPGSSPAAAPASTAPKSPVLNKTPPADLFKHKLDAMLGKK